MSYNTKNSISEAFISLAKKKNIDRITVKDLVTLCGISRQSFYYHFRDIEDIIEWTIRQEIQKGIRNLSGTASPEEAFKSLIQNTAKEYNILTKLLQSQYKDLTLKIFLEGLKIYLWEIVRQNHPNYFVNLNTAEISLDFYAYGICGLLIQHCADKHLDVDLLARQLCDFSKQ